MDFRSFDARRYHTLPVAQGYGEWAGTYEQTVPDELDLPLLSRIKTVQWQHVSRAADLACGTGRTALWLHEMGVNHIDGVDITPQMIEQARNKNVHKQLCVSDVANTPLESDNYDLAIMVLADEHLSDLAPVYGECARLLGPGGQFVIVGYHPHFLMLGIPTHFHRADGQPVAVESYVHLFSEHVSAATHSGLNLQEMHEGVINDAWIAAKPKWERYRDHPVSFAAVWKSAR